MASTIWKFPLATTDEQIVKAPAHWEPLSVQLQGGIPFLWAVVDPARPVIEHTVWMHGTGHPLPDIRHLHVGRQFVGTLLLLGGRLVLHVFADRVF